MPPEANLQRRVVSAIKRRFPSAWVYHPCDRKRMGVPDLLICVNGRFVAVELKAAGRKPTELQRFTLDKITHAGGIAGWATDLDQVFRIVEQATYSITSS